MGSKLTRDLSEETIIGNLKLKEAVIIQLRNNHYPPVPMMMVSVAMEAIKNCETEDYETMIKLPEGILWKEKEEISTQNVMEAFHLWEFLNQEIEE